MKEIYLHTVQQFNELYGFETLHPLVSVVRYDSPKEVEEMLVSYGLYAIFLKENKGCQLSYGRTKYDFDEMTVTTFAPGQTAQHSTERRERRPSLHPSTRYPDRQDVTSLGKDRDTRLCQGGCRVGKAALSHRKGGVS